MKTLIIKLGAAGDVVRTTTLLSVLEGRIDWLIDDANALLLNGAAAIANCVPWSERQRLNGDTYDRVINLEDSQDAAEVLQKIEYESIFGAFLDDTENLAYTDDSSEWFDLSLISRFGKDQADMLKLKNRKSYQEMIFSGLQSTFCGEEYFLPDPVSTELVGDVAIAPKAGSVWPMKNWYGYEELQKMLEEDGLTVNVLPNRPSLLEHIGDVKNHRCLVSGDSLPMHIALGAGTRCVTLFTCTSPWEIYEYGLQTQIIATTLDTYFYKRTFDPKATTSISVDTVYRATIASLEDGKPS